jgi:hypothetical protein
LVESPLRYSVSTTGFSVKGIELRVLVENLLECSNKLLLVQRFVPVGVHCVKDQFGLGSRRSFRSLLTGLQANARRNLVGFGGLGF